MRARQKPAKTVKRTARKPRRTQEQRRTETRHKLIEAAIQLLHESGFACFTFAEVASRAGLTTGAVQHHFRSSDDLLRGVIDALFPMLHINICEPDILASPIPERINRIVDVYWRELYARPDYLVIWELMFGTRKQGTLQVVLKTMQKEFIAKGVGDFARVFADTGMSSSVAFRLFTFIASQLRGLALLSMYEGERVLKDDLILLKKAVFQIMLE